MAKQQVIAFQPPKGISREDVEARAKLFKMRNLSELAREGLKLMMTFDPQAFATVQEYADGYKVPLAEFFQHCALYVITQLETQQLVVHKEIRQVNPR